MRKTGMIFKKMMTGVLAATVIASGISLVPMKAEAAYAYEDTVLYLNEEYAIRDYWSVDSKTAPVKEGYVFGGWYADGEGNTPLTEETAQEATSAYAKFVPAYVLSVKAQIDTKTVANDSKTASIRVVSSVDNKNYQKVGFDILLANRHKVYKDNDLEKKDPLETTTIYTGLKVGDADPIGATQIFGAKSAYLSVWRLDHIQDVNDSKIINVTPYWITMDGTKVEGIAKYVHVEDGYNKYVSVPVHVSSGNFAAGALAMSYPSDILTVKDVEFCNQDGALLEKAEVSYVDDGAGTIKFVANAASVNDSFATDGIYANVRFTVKADSVYKGVGTGTFLDFTVSGESFCDWKEDSVVVSAWNIQY